MVYNGTLQTPLNYLNLKYWLRLSEKWPAPVSTKFEDKDICYKWKVKYEYAELILNNFLDWLEFTFY